MGGERGKGVVRVCRWQAGSVVPTRIHERRSSAPPPRTRELTSWRCGPCPSTLQAVLNSSAGVHAPIKPSQSSAASPAMSQLQALHVYRPSSSSTNCAAKGRRQQGGREPSALVARSHHMLCSPASLCALTSRNRRPIMSGREPSRARVSCRRRRRRQRRRRVRACQGARQGTMPPSCQTRAAASRGRWQAPCRAAQ